MVQDRRQNRRFVVVDLELRYEESGDAFGRVVNLSQGGMLVNSIHEFDKGQKLSLRIPFNRPVEGEINFDFQGEVAWCMPDAHDDFSVGLQFVDNSELQYKFLQKMIYLYVKPSE